MIDIHSHIIFGVDDGSKDIENSINMAKEAEKNGITHICCTPHYLAPEYVSNYKDNDKKVKKINKKLKDENIDVELRLGNEIFITETTLDDLKENRAIAMNDSKYVLVELPMVNELKCAESIIDKLCLNGYKVIIAHPERYKYVQDNPDYMIPYLNKGVYFQSNIGSVIGMYGEGARVCINTLLKRNMIQILATDAHKTNSVYYKLDRIVSKMKEKISEDYFEELTLLNPQNVLNDEELIVRKYKKKKRFIFF